METLQYNPPGSIRDKFRHWSKTNASSKTNAGSKTSASLKINAGVGLLTRARLTIALCSLLTLFLFAGMVLQRIDPAAGVLDIGILSVVLLGLLGGLVAVICSLWLQELLWQPFKTFRKQLRPHFDQLSSWQQCILYFSVFFLLLYAVLWGLAMVL